MNIIKQIKRRLIPPCSACAHSREKTACLYTLDCTNPRGLDLLEKLSGEARRKSMDCCSARETKYCNFKERDA